MSMIQHKLAYGNKIYKRIKYFGKLAPPKYVVREDLNLLYLPISKAGNSSIKKALIPTTVQIQDDNSVHANREGIIRSYQFKEKWNNYYKFTFVRNPFERLISCYISKYHNDKKYTPDHLWFDNYLFGIMKNDYGFEAFANKVCMISDKYADEHFISQYSQIYKNNVAQVDRIGKLENINQDFEPIRSRYDLPRIPHFNQSQKGNWMDFYTIDLAQKVYQRYEMDIKFFDYQREYNRLLIYLSSQLNKQLHFPLLHSPFHHHSTNTIII